MKTRAVVCAIFSLTDAVIYTYKGQPYGYLSAGWMLLAVIMLLFVKAKD